MKRAFFDAPQGQVHAWTGGTGPPLVMLHASPGSARQLLPLARLLAQHFTVLAPDTPGNGDSDPLQAADPTIENYADALASWLPAAAAPAAIVYGSHTGANIALALANRHPALVRTLVLDGLALYSDEERDLFLQRYAPEVKPDRHGAHLLWAFHFCRDQCLFFPWFASDGASRLAGGLPEPGELHDWAMEVLKALPTYQLAYRAAFRFDKRAALAACRHLTLVVATAGDPVATRQAAVAESMNASVCRRVEAADQADLAARIAEALGQ